MRDKQRARVWVVGACLAAAATAPLPAQPPELRAALKGHAPPVEAGASYRVERTTADRTRRSASHHALVVEATAGGTGFLGSGGTLELTVAAELVYVGPGRE